MRKEGYFIDNGGDVSGNGFVNWAQGFTPITQSESLHSTLSAQYRRHGKDAVEADVVGMRMFERQGQKP